MDHVPTAAHLKASCPSDPRVIAQLFAEKGFGLAESRLFLTQPSFGLVLAQLLLQAPQPAAIARAWQQESALSSLPLPAYMGTNEENRLIDQAMLSQPLCALPGCMRATTWKGASGAYLSAGVSVPPAVGQTPILILGAGAAGILAARALANAGFTQITILEKQGRIGGIWGQDMPRRILHAVPFPLQFEQVRLEAGPRPGQMITSFLETLVAPPLTWGWPPFPRICAAEVMQIQTGDLHHHVRYLDVQGCEREIVAPIVITAVGVGEPLPPSWSGAMTADLAPEQAGVRWQAIWSEADARRLNGKTLTFISLSNATLSMLWQIQAWRRRGLEIDYHILTHYPQASIDDPQARIAWRGRHFRLYRDLEQGRLLRMAGDMHPFRAAFHEARAEGRIAAQITHWTLGQQGDQRVIVATDNAGRVQHIPTDELYTLIGYGPRAELLERLGLSVNHRYMGAVDQDYDGEVQRAPGMPGRQRLWPGYFCLGLRNGFNENEVLLPGLFHRLPNLVASVALRCGEYAFRSSRSEHPCCPGVCSHAAR